MKIILAAIEDELVEAWRVVFDPQTEVEVEIYPGSLFDLHVDAIVSPANSFGFMDGSLDYLISQNLGWHLQEKLQKIIQEEHAGELIVGNAQIIETDNARFPYLVSAPTMRVPMVLAGNSINSYLATKAAFYEAKKNKKIDSIVFPGMGTGVGMVPPYLCAIQMLQAFKDVLYPSFPKSWRESQVKHIHLFGQQIDNEQEYIDSQHEPRQ
jgi:O-acetyl-ADP-ribose deacetylase (regulator of RNase III)